MKNRWFYIFYFFILFVLLVSTFMRSSPLPMTFRLIFFLLLFLPSIKFNYLFFPCLVLFYSVSALSLGCTFMPTEISYYVYLSGLFAVAGYLKNKPSFPGYPILLFSSLWVLIVLVDFINSSSIEKVSYSLLCFVLVLASITKQNLQKVMVYVPNAFIVATFTSSVLLLINREYFMVQSGDDFERLVSASINYSCSTIGIGSVMAFMLAMKKTGRFIHRVFYFTTFAVSIVVLLMEASRGALLSVAIACVFIVLFSGLKTTYKIFGVLFIVVFTIILYQNNSFDLLIYRIQDDDGTGSNRTSLWTNKLNAFRSTANSLEYLLGIGFDRAVHLGSNKVVYLHNDFLAFFIEYGFIGFGVFIWFLLYPLIKAEKAMRPTIYPFIAFIITTSFLLEPFTAGYLPLYFLLLYVYLLAFRKESIPI